MEYCVLIEHNQEEHESYIFYLQWNGNEEALQTLYGLVEEADVYSLLGDTNSFEMHDPRVRISQSAVDEHMNIGRCTFRTFQAVNGIFTLPFSDDEIGDMDAYDIERMLKQVFFRSHIKDYFKQ
jgi:hypothetical protein